jgi:hypothetical protein
MIIRPNPPAGAIFRTRDTWYKDGTAFEIREKSERGEWVVYGTYLTKSERIQAWQDLANTGLYVMDWNQDAKTNEEETMTGTALTPEVLPAETGEGKAFEEWKARQDEVELDYALFAANMEAKIYGAAGRESMERLIRVLHLRQAKEKLTPLGRWAKWCDEVGIDARSADYEISKLGDWKDDLLTKFVSYAGIPFNKIRQLTNGDLQKLQVTAGNNEIIVNGEVVPLEKEEIEFVIDSLQEETRRAELKAAEDMADLQKSAKETAKQLKKAEKELKKLRGEAKGMTDEEVAYMTQLDDIKKRVTEAVTEFNNLALGDGDTLTASMLLGRKALLDYMLALVDSADVQSPSGV